MWLRASLVRSKTTLAGVFQHPDEFRHRQTDHVPEIAVDAVDEGRASPLDRIAAGAALPLARREIRRDLVRVQTAEADPRHGRRGLLVAVARAQHDAAVDLVRPPRQS